jgi:UDP:flavonoid glycosyltransferase YjiC (YdhE family)
MRNPSYTKAAQKLMNASQACGGVEAAAQQVEWAARYGIGHMKPTNFKQLGN